jgi:DNA invertase Pin-like site-specific DNA recombinase
MSDKITPAHTSRKAVVYVRQSSLYQVVHNTESRRLQYAMRQRVQQLGWREIELIDEDLGCSAAGTVTRAGFERMVSEVCLGKVGAIAARELSRFARNSRDWQKLIEVCRVVDTLLIDQETVYDARRSNDRLLLGLKGSLNEYELDLLRQRALEARRAKASRGELVLQAPVGFVKIGKEALERDPDQRVQEAIRLVFRKFFELGAARQTLLWFLEQDLKVPVRRKGSLGWETLWRRPAYPYIHHVLTNPVYAGAYAYGRTEVVSEFRDGQPKRTIRRRPREAWLTLMPDRHEGYVSWDEFERIQQMLFSNSFSGEGMTTGAAKRGPALLAGLLRCRRCGRKLMVHYTGRRRDMIRYTCCRGQLDNCEPRCISFGGLEAERAVSRELLHALRPAAVDAARQAAQQVAGRQDEVLAALQRDLQAAEYAAQRAEKQYDLADPENRLVAEELERRWNQALDQVMQLERRIADETACRHSAAPPTAEEFLDLAADLQTIWDAPETDVRLKKRMLRTLVREIIVDLDEPAGQIQLVLHWQGGVHTQIEVRRRRRGHCRTHTPPEIAEAVRVLVRVGTDAQIAGWLNRDGLRTGRGNRWTKERVTSLRSKRNIPRHDADRETSPGWLTLMAAAKQLGVSHTTLRIAAERGEIAADHPLANGPWIFHRDVLTTPQAAALLAKAKRRRGQGAAPLPGQQHLDFSGT